MRYIFPRSDLLHYVVQCLSRLLGRPLFRAEDVRHLYALNLECEIDLSFPRDPSLPPNMKSLLAGMLEKDPNKRMSADEVVHHDFFENLRRDPEFAGEYEM